jgi:hypothetical protein
MLATLQGQLRLAFQYKAVSAELACFQRRAMTEIIFKKFHHSEKKVGSGKYTCCR